MTAIINTIVQMIGFFNFTFSLSNNIPKLTTYYYTMNARKNQYLIIRRYGICSKKYVMKNICIALSIVGIIFSAGLVLLRGRK